MAEERSGVAHRDGWVTLGLAVSALSAAVSSFAGLRDLAVVGGWPALLAPLLPLTVDVYGMTATRVWLAASTRSVRARRFARTNSVSAILLSLIGNATYHLIAVRLVAASWVVVVAVGAVPALVLGLVTHLAVLRSEANPAASGLEPVRPESGPAAQPVRTEAGPRYPSEAELIAAARVADAAHRAAHGRGMSRDALRRELGIGGARATAVARRLKEEHDGAKLAMPNKALEGD